MESLKFVIYANLATLSCDEEQLESALMNIGVLHRASECLWFLEKECGFAFDPPTGPLATIMDAIDQFVDEDDSRVFVCQIPCRRSGNAQFDGVLSEVSIAFLESPNHL